MPKTNYYCVKCHREIKPSSPHRLVHVVGGGAEVLHPAFESRYAPDAGDLGWFAVGMDCARKLGLEWTHKP